MRDLLLLLSVLAIFVIGYFIMGRVDRFMGRNQQQDEEYGIECPKEKTLVDKKTFL